MDNATHERFTLEDRSYLSSVKSGVRKLASQVGFSDYQLGEVDIVTSELATNLVKHTPKGGEILVKPLGENQDEGIEIISLDNGRGMISPMKMISDGVSTSNTLGQGLGAIKRLSQYFDMYSQKDWGTIVLSRMFKQKEKLYTRPGLFSYDLGTFRVPKKGETKCGDGYAVLNLGSHVKLIVADGLGHGTEAGKASDSAIAAFKKVTDQPLNLAVKSIHEEIRRSRGAVAALVDLDLKSGTFNYCGVGNISGRIFLQDNIKSCISYNGIVGHNIPNSLNVHSFEIGEKDVLILNSDGLTNRWDLSRHPGIFRLDPVMIAAIAYKDCSRGTDDSMVVVIKNIRRNENGNPQA